MIILYDENELLFQSLGLGLLRDAKSCIIKEGLNDSFELEMQYPLTGSNFSKLALNKIILAKPNPYSQAQPFRIYSISKPINGVVTVKAFHISYDMNGIIVKPINASTPQILIDKIQNGTLIDHSFKFYTDITESKSFKTSSYYNMRALLMGSDESVLEIYKGEILFDRFDVNILAKRGSDKGASIRYAKNMKDITHEVNYERLYNGVYPFYHKEEVEVTTDTSSDGFKQVYIVGTKPYQDGWFSYSAGGEPYHPVDESPVQVASDGDYKDKVFVWNTTTQRYTEKVYNEMVNLIEYVTDLISPSDKPTWIYIDVSSLPSIVVKANTDGYFKLATDQDWSKKIKGEVVFQGSITNATDGLIMYYSEVIPSSETSQETETTSVSHIELDDQIIWLTTDAASQMKYNRILCLDLTSEFDETPDKEKLETKAKEYIEENKIGQYKYDTQVSFIDLASTTEGTVYDKLETIELGDTVKVIYEGLGINTELRVISTTYNALTNKYDNIELGEKSEKISSSSVQSGDNISSLTNDVGYADTTTVNKLIAKTVTADLIQAKNAKLSKAQIEELQTARIKVTGLIEATQFELDTLVAKMLTADNAVIKQTLEAGTVKVKGDITVTKGSISIENTNLGTVFNVDRDGNLTANSVYINGGELNINDNFIVTQYGILTAYGAQIKGKIEAEEGLIANFTIESYDTVDGSSNRLYSGEPGTENSVLISPGYIATISNLSVEEKTWAFLAGDSFGVTTKGLLIAANADISGKISATSGIISGFTIESDKLSANSIEISPEHILYGKNNEFEVTSDGTLKIQNTNKFSLSYWEIVLALNYNASIVYQPGEYCIFINELYICKELTVIGAFNAIYWTKLNASEYNEHSFYTIGDYCKYNNVYYRCISPIGYQYIQLTGDGLTANSIYVKNADITLGRIGGFTIGEKSLYKDIESFDSEGSETGVYLGSDGLRIGKNLKIFPDGRIMSGSRNYNEDVIYNPGDYCIQNDSLFKCIVRTTGGLFDSSMWEEVSARSFGVDDTGKLVASCAEIIGNITAESGYIGNPREGFTINSRAIYNGFENPLSSATDEGVYLGTDGIRLGKKVSQQFNVNIGNLSSTGSTQIISIYDENNNISFIGSEFILSYDSKSYDRYIEIREKESQESVDSDEDYIHIDNPNFIPIEGKTQSNETIFNISNSNYTYISVDDSSLWEYDSTIKQYSFKGVSGIRLYFDNLSTTTSIKVEYFDSKEDWMNGNNPHDRFSGNINILSGKSNVEFTLAPTDSPWIRFKISNGISELTNCKIIQDIIKLVLLPANSSEKSFTAVKYNNIKFKYVNGKDTSNPEVSNLKLTLKILPGFLVTPDGMMHAYNAKIWGHFEGDVNINSGAIRIESSGITYDQVICKFHQWIDEEGAIEGESSNEAYTFTAFDSTNSKLTYNHIEERGTKLIDYAIFESLETFNGKTYGKWARYEVEYPGLTTYYKTGYLLLNAQVINGKLHLVGDDSSITQFLVTSSGEMTANQATITGKITATSGKIGGFEIWSNGYDSKTVDTIIYGNIGETNSVVMSPGYQAIISNLSPSFRTWVFTAGNSFGVTSSGELYSVSGYIGGFSISSSGLSNYYSGNRRFRVKSFETNYNIPEPISSDYNQTLECDTIFVNDIRVTGSYRGFAPSSSDPSVEIYFISSTSSDSNISLSNSYQSSNGLVTVGSYRVNNYSYTRYYSKIPARDIRGILYITAKTLNTSSNSTSLKTTRTNPVVGYASISSSDSDSGVITKSYDTGLSGIYYVSACYDQNTNSDGFTNFGIQSWSSGGTVYVKWNNHNRTMPNVKVFYIGYYN